MSSLFFCIEILLINVPPFQIYKAKNKSPPKKGNQYSSRW
jgi:hypothetical protein